MALESVYRGGSSTAVERKYLLGVAIGTAGFACLFITLQGLLQLGILRPAAWARRYSRGELAIWRERLPGFGIPLGVAVLLGAVALAWPSIVARSVLAGMASLLVACAILVGVGNPTWARPAWLQQPGADNLVTSRGERVLLIVGSLELGLMAIVYLVAEGLSAITFGLILLAAGGILRALPRRHNRARP